VATSSSRETVGTLHFFFGLDARAVVVVVGVAADERAVLDIVPVVDGVLVARRWWL
jgi:hypothetical protein